MARMVPELDDPALELVESNAEQAVYRSLRDSLGREVLVVHSLDLVAHPPGAQPVDAEADFVIFNPNRGFLVIEVKGGGIAYDGAERRWWSTDRNGVQHQIKDPFRQARNAKYEVLRNLKARKGWGSAGMPRVIAGHAAIFPDLLDVQALAGPDRPIAIIGSSYILTNASGWVTAAFEFWGRNVKTSEPLGKRGMSIIESLFCRKVTVQVPLALTIEREQRRQIELTERQGRILRSLRHRHRASIAGGAGTGKTLLALQHAKTLAAQGVSTLLLCFNRALADFLKRETGGKPNLHAMSFHQLCDWRVKVVHAETGLDLLKEAEKSYPGRSFFDVHMPYALARSTELDKCRYQAVVVDEGQDFGDEYWLPIELLLQDEDDSPLYVFFDPNQAVYRNASTFPIADAPLLLTENCRNTRNIHTVTYQFYVGDEVDPPDIEGVPPQLLEAAGLDQQARKIKDVVSELLTKERVSPQDVVILVLSHEKRAFYQALQRAGNPIGASWSFEALWKHDTVLVDTARRFKGLEAGIVLIWGVERIRPERDRELLYVAFSRARSRLWFVGTRGVIESVIGRSTR